MSRSLYSNILLVFLGRDRHGKSIVDDSLDLSTVMNDARWRPNASSFALQSCKLLATITEVLVLPNTITDRGWKLKTLRFPFLTCAISVTLFNVRAFSHRWCIAPQTDEKSNCPINRSSCLFLSQQSLWQALRYRRHEGWKRRDHTWSEQQRLSLPRSYVSFNNVRGLSFVVEYDPCKIERRLDGFDFVAVDMKVASWHTRIENEIVWMKHNSKRNNSKRGKVFSSDACPSSALPSISHKRRDWRTPGPISLEVDDLHFSEHWLY